MQSVYESTKKLSVEITEKSATPVISARVKAATGTVDLSLFLLEHLVASHKPVGISDLARTFNSSKPTIYRHIQALVKHGFARQDKETNRYEAGFKLMALGEALRERFNIVAVARNAMLMLREATGQAVSLSALHADEVIALEILNGRTVVEFGIKPGTRMDLHATAHGKIALAYGPSKLLEQMTRDAMRSWTADTLTSLPALRKTVAMIRRRGWATAANEIVPGVNALAAPIFDHRDVYTGAVAIIGSTHIIEANPRAELINLVSGAALEISRALGSSVSLAQGEKI
jgi:DNA-binding IclR family transcriptional regulator